MAVSPLTTAWSVDEVLMSEGSRIVGIRFGHDWDPICKAMDEQINRVAPCVTDIAAFFTVDNSEVPDFSKLYELHDPMTLTVPQRKLNTAGPGVLGTNLGDCRMLFYRKKHVMADVGFGLTNKISWCFRDAEELRLLLHSLHKGAMEGKNLAHVLAASRA